MSRTRYELLITLLALFGTGCGTLQNGHLWGKDATLFPGLDRVGRSAVHAALDPVTLVFAVGALVFVADDFDRKVSHWATEKTPVFGSHRTANDVSDILMWSLGGCSIATALATPSGGEAWELVESKAEGIAVEGAAFAMAVGTTEVLKHTVRRMRPNQTSELSFPSGHATAGFAAATLTSKNLDSLSLSGGLRIGLKAMTYSASVATAWARVEADKHYPSDVLAGAAIGHFLTAFIHDSFLGLPENTTPFHLEFAPVKKGFLLSAGWAF